MACAILAGSVADAREKIDAVFLKNGDRITGEIKNLESGILTISTDHLGTVSVEWISVASIESTQLFEMLEANGDQKAGTFGPGPVSGELTLSQSKAGQEVFSCEEIVRITQLGRTQWQRWTGNVSVGASFTSSNNQRDLSLDAEATYQNQRFRLRNTLTGAISDVDEGTRNSWGTVASNYQRYLQNRWFWYSQLQLDRNEGLDLDLRTTVSGGGGRYLVANSRSQFYMSLGLSALREVYSTEESGDWSSEIAVTGDYELFVFQGRETSINASLSILPSLSVSNRYRLEYAVSFNRKLIRDFTISLNLNGSYDSKPPEDSKASDTSLTFNLGWSY